MVNRQCIKNVAEDGAPRVQTNQKIMLDEQKVMMCTQYQRKCEFLNSTVPDSAQHLLNEDVIEDIYKKCVTNELGPQKEVSDILMPKDSFGGVEGYGEEDSLGV